MTERVLLVDDEKEFLEIMSERMQARDIEVTTSTSALEAMDLIATESYDAVIMDFMMPEMNGIEALKAIKEKNPAARVIVLYRDMRAYGLKEDYYKQARDLGVIFFLFTPEDKPVIDAITGSAISRLRPVGMAAATTILGMAPLFPDAFFVSMAVTIAFGLGFASVLTMVVVPVLYATIFPVKSR